MLQKDGPALRFLMVAGANVAAAGAGLALFSLMARSQGPADLGHMALAMSFLVYGLILSNFGTDSIAIRAVSQDLAAAPKMVGSVMAFRLANNMLILAGGAMLVWHFRGSPTSGLMMILAGSLMIGAIAPAWLAPATERSDVLGIYNFASPMATLLFAAALLFAEWPQGIYAFAAARVAGDLVAALGLMRWASAAIGRIAKPQLVDVVQLARSAMPIGLSRLASGLGQAADLLIVSAMLSDVQTGIYAAALRVYLLIMSMSLLFSGVIFPAFARAALDGNGRVKCLLLSSVKRSFPLAVAAALAIALLAPYLLRIIFGPQFAGADTILRLLCIAGVFNFVAVVIGTALLAVGQFHIFMRNTLISTAILIAGKIVLTAKFGMTGAAVATSVAEAAMMILQWRSLVNICGVQPQPTEPNLHDG